MPSPENKDAGDAKLTEDQQSFLDECEEEFRNRYTDEDADYKKIKEIGIETPPIIHPWYNKPRRNFDWTNKQRDRDQRPRNNYPDYRNRYSNKTYDNSHRSQYRYRPYR